MTMMTICKTDFIGDEQNPQNQAIQPDGAPFGYRQKWPRSEAMCWSDLCQEMGCPNIAIQNNMIFEWGTLFRSPVGLLIH